MTLWTDSSSALQCSPPCAVKDFLSLLLSHDLTLVLSSRTLAVCLISPSVAKSQSMDTLKSNLSLETLWIINRLNNMRFWKWMMRKINHSAALTEIFSAAGLQSPIIAIEPHSTTVRVGESATFRCKVYSGAQPVRLEWKLANSQPLPGRAHTHTHTRCEITERWQTRATAA